MRLRVGVYAAAIDDGSILLTLQSPDDVDPGRWNLPGGGMRWGETPEETLVREVHEETGLYGDVGELLLVRTQTYRDQPDPVHTVQIVFAMHLTGEPHVVEMDGSTIDARWIPIVDLRGLPTVALVDELLTLAS